MTHSLSVNSRPNGMPPSPVGRYAERFRQAAPSVLLLSHAQFQRGPSPGTTSTALNSIP